MTAHSAVTNQGAASTAPPGNFVDRIRRFPIRVRGG
jgi:hypothetical protein